MFNNSLFISLYIFILNCFVSYDNCNIIDNRKQVGVCNSFLPCIIKLYKEKLKWHLNFFSRKIQTFLLHIKAYDVIPVFDSCSNNNYNIEDIETYSMRFIFLISKKIDSNNTQISLITSMSALV